MYGADIAIPGGGDRGQLIRPERGDGHRVGDSGSYSRNRSESHPSRLAGSVKREEAFWVDFLAKPAMFHVEHFALPAMSEHKLFHVEHARRPRIAQKFSTVTPDYTSFLRQRTNPR